jgi:uncharacterized protein
MQGAVIALRSPNGFGRPDAAGDSARRVRGSLDLPLRSHPCSTGRLSLRGLCLSGSGLARKNWLNKVRKAEPFLDKGKTAMLFAVIRHDKPNSLDLRLSKRPRHLEYLKTVLDKIVYGGALLDDEGKQIGSMLIIDVAGEAEANAFAVADPFVDADLFASTSVRQFRQVFKDGTWL